MQKLESVPSLVPLAKNLNRHWYRLQKPESVPAPYPLQTFESSLSKRDLRPRQLDSVAIPRGAVCVLNICTEYDGVDEYNSIAGADTCIKVIFCGAGLFVESNAFSGSAYMWVHPR